MLDASRLPAHRLHRSLRQLSALPRAFFADHPVVVARHLLGQRLVRRLDGELLVGRIVEAEAYGAAEDSTSHGFRGPGGRANGMFTSVGRAYVYLIYGMHHCLNVVAHVEPGAGAVLIRAIAPEAGVEVMRARRGGVADVRIGSGPGRLCAALAIDRTLDGHDLCDETGPLFFAPGADVRETAVRSGPRVGVRGRPADVALPWRFYIRDEPNVSPGRQGTSRA